MLKNILLFIVFAVGFISASPSGEVHGIILTAKTGEPLEGVNVSIEGTVLGAASDADGYYRIVGIPAGEYTVSAYLVGYEESQQTIEIRVDQSIKLTFHLRQTVLSSSSVLVLGHREEIEAVRKQPFSVSVIDAQAVQARAIDLNEVLSRAAGVQLRQAGGTGSESRISIRGLEGKQVQVFIDGRPLNTPDGTFGINDIPLIFIKRIEVYKGIIPARFGGNGLGGAINVVMNEYETDYLDLGLSRQSFNTNNISTVFVKNFPAPGIKVGAGGWFTFAENNYTMASPFQPGLEINRDHDAFTSVVGAVSLSFSKLWFDEIELEMPILYGKKELQGVQQNIQHAQSKYQAYVGALAMDKTGFFHENLDFNYSLILPLGYSQMVDTSRYRYTFQGERFLSPSGIGELGFSGQNSDNRIFEGSQRINLNLDKSSTQSYNLNLSSRYSTFSPEDPLQNEYLGYDISQQKSKIVSNTLGLTHEISFLGGRLANVVGGKHYAFYSEGYESDIYGSGSGQPPAKTSNFVGEFGFNNGIRLRLNEQIMLKFSYERALRLPTANELYGDGIFLQPSPDIKPESSHNFHAGFLFDKLDSHYRRFQIEVNGFYMRLNDMIQLTGNGITNGYVNLGETRIVGADAEIKADVTNNLYAYLNATYQDSRDILEFLPATSVPNPTEGLRVPNIPWLFGNLGVEYTFRELFGDNQKTKVYLESSYVEEFFYGWEVSNNQNLRIPSSTEHTAGLEFSFNANTFFVSAEIKNLTNERTYNIFNNPLPGRIFAIKLRRTIFGK